MLCCAIDMIQERNALMEHVYPRLKKLCREKYRLEFQVRPCFTLSYEQYELKVKMNVMLYCCTCCRQRRQINMMEWL